MCGRYTDLDAPEFRSHARTCPDCAALLALQGPESLEPSKATRDAIFDVIREEAARRRKRPTTRRVRVRRLTPAPASGWHVALAAAAAVVFALLVGYALGRPPAPSRPRDVSPVVRRPEPAPEPPPVPLPPIERPKDLIPPPPAPVVPPRDVPAPEPRPTPVPVPPAPAPPPAPKPTIVEAPAPAREFARVVRVTGSADAKKGDVLLTGQPVSCKLGLVLLEMADETQIVLRAGASITAESAVSIRLHDGEVACSVRKGRTFAVDFAHGSAAVRGTMFSVKTQASGAAVVVSRGRVEVGNAEGKVDVAAGERARLVKGAAPSKPEPVQADRLLEWAGLRVIGPLWVVAGASELRAPMARGRLDGSLSPEPVFGAVDARTLKSWGGRFLAPNGDEGGTATFTVDIPHDGDWRLWGRMFHPASGAQIFRQAGDVPDNDPNSFYVSVDGAPERVFGNHKGFYRRWHWAGDGAVETGTPAGLSLTLTKGRHVLRLRPRDPVETSSLRLAPRLDVLCLTPDPDYRPRDEDYRKP